MPTDFVTIKSFTTEVEAQIAGGRLEASGIESVIVKDDCGGAYPVLQSIQGVKLNVREQDADRALNILETEFSAEQDFGHFGLENPFADWSLSSWLLALEGRQEKSDIRILRVENSDAFDPDIFADWEVTPIHTDVLLEQQGLFILSAFHVTSPDRIADCFIDLTMPERIADYAYFVTDGVVERRFINECDGEIVGAVPIDGCGPYDLFYSRINPGIGLSVLRRGLDRSPRKACIAEDLGYILRDEGRVEEAIEAFALSVAEGPSSYFIYQELADLYDRVGRPDLATGYREMIPESNDQAPKKPWWKLW